MSFLRQARVAAVNPGDHSVDIVMVDDGSRFPGVQTMSPTALTDCGLIDLPSVGATGEKYSLTQTTGRDAIAIVGFLAPTVPVVVGFIVPQVNQLAFAEQNRRVMRHASDLYETVDKDANYELYHPSGTYLRIGTSGEHEDLSGKNFDGNWAISKNTDKAVHLKIRVSNAGVDKASIDIDPSGNISIQCDGNATLQVDGNLAATVAGTTSVTSTGNATVKAPKVKVDSPESTFTGAVIVQGLLTYQAGMAGSGGSGNSANITGNVQVTGTITASGEVKSGAIGLTSHHHTAQGATAPTTASQA